VRSEEGFRVEPEESAESAFNVIDPTPSVGDFLATEVYCAVAVDEYSCGKMQFLECPAATKEVGMAFVNTSNRRICTEIKHGFGLGDAAQTGGSPIHPTMEETFCACFCDGRYNSYGGSFVYFVHLSDFLKQINRVILDNAESINPDVINIELTSQPYGLPNSGWEPSNREGNKIRVDPITRGFAWLITAPTVRQGSVTYNAGLNNEFDFIATFNDFEKTFWSISNMALLAQRMPLLAVVYPTCCSEQT
jgi:hypothetical protein